MTDSRISRFFRNMKGKTTAFIGIGVSHTDLMRFYRQKGLAVIACDKRTREQIGPLADELEVLGITLRLGEGYLKGLSADVVFRTPGMLYGHPALAQLKKRGAVITSEMEVFFELCPCPIFAITGSDGKTTTTTIISELFKAQGKTVHLGGNIGLPLLASVEKIEENDMAVVELSSFQLISMRCSMNVSVITNISPNHLDMHKDMQEYIDAKRNVYLHQNGFSRTVLNEDNEITAGFMKEVRGELLSFSMKHPVEKGCYLGEDNILYMACGDKTIPVISASDIRIPGRHNVANFMAAICAVWGYVDIPVIEKLAKTFGGVEHRIEFVREVNGVRWYNDSIATAPTRTIAALNAFDRKIILIAGGSDKNIPYLPIGQKIVDNVKLLILLGVTAQKIEDTVKSMPDFEKSGLAILRVNSLEQAVAKANEAAQSGDIVVLSPASASFDMFKDYKERGHRFKDLVSSL